MEFFLHFKICKTIVFKHSKIDKKLMFTGNIEIGTRIVDKICALHISKQNRSQPIYFRIYTDFSTILKNYT